jgi:hypothetical protein
MMPGAALDRLAADRARQSSARKPPEYAVARLGEQSYNPGMLQTLLSRTVSDRLILYGCLLMAVPCILSTLAAAFFCWPIFLPGGLR